MTYAPLTKGDIRQQGDEVKPLPFPSMYDNRPRNRNAHLNDDWQPVSPGLLGVEIDFHHVKTAEYRRPIK